MNLIRSFIEDFKQWRAGNRRVAPRHVRGRIYQPKGGTGGPHRIDAKMDFRTYARVIRADGRPDEFIDTQTGEKMTAEKYFALSGRKPSG